MELESITCNHCGAPLQVPSTADYVTCNHCGSQLAVRRGGSVTFTEVVQQLSETTENLAQQVSKLRHQTELETLERQWEAERESFMVTNNTGAKRLPDESSSMLGGIITTVFGLFWTVMAIGITSSAPSFGVFGIAKLVFPAFGVLFIVFGIVSAARNSRKAREYKVAEQAYRRRRQRLLDDEP